MNFFNSPIWHGIVQFLQNPIVVGIITVFFAILLIRFLIRRASGQIKSMLGLLLLAGFVWLLLTNKGFAQVIAELLHGIFTIVLFLLIALLVLVFVFVLSITVMYVVNNPSRTRRSLSSGTGRGFPSATFPPIYTDSPYTNIDTGIDGNFAEHQQYIFTLLSELGKVYDEVLDIDTSARPIPLILQGIHAVLFGFRERLPELKRIHQACNEEMADLIQLLATTRSGANVEELEAIRRSKKFFPKEGEWESLDDMMEGKARFFMKLLFLNRGWQEQLTIGFKLSICHEIVLSNMRQE